MDNDFRARLDALDEENLPLEIIEAILAVPEEERDYEMTCHLARAYNNTGDYESAMSQLLSVAGEGENDYIWHYRYGYALYYSDRYEEALDEFMSAKELEPGDEWTEAYILWCIARIEAQESSN